jgi:hypothetical protein
MDYLQASEYEQFGLESATGQPYVAMASRMMEAFCGHRELGVKQYKEQLRVTRGRNRVRLTYTPLAAIGPATTAIVSVRARYGVPRRGEAPELEPLLAAAQVLGLPGAFTSVDAASVDYDADTGEVTFPLSVFGLGFNEVEVTYTAGYAPIPDAVKHACAQIVRNALDTPGLNVRSGQLDSLRVDYFQDSLLDESVKAMLRPFVALKVA